MSKNSPWNSTGSGRPDRLQRLERFREALAADVPVAADGLVLLGRPTDPETHAQSALGEDIDRREATREQRRVVPGQDEHADAESDPARLPGDERQRLERIERRLVDLWNPTVCRRIGEAGLERDEQALGRPETVEAELLCPKRHLGQRVGPGQGADGR
jgi:hypothetical protein